MWRFGAEVFEGRPRLFLVGERGRKEGKERESGGGRARAAGNGR